MEARKINGKQDRNNAVDALRDKIMLDSTSPSSPASPTPITSTADKRRREAKEALRRLEEKTYPQLVV